MLDAIADRAGAAARADRRRPPPVRRLPAARSSASPAGHRPAVWRCWSTRTTPRSSSARSTACCSALTLDDLRTAAAETAGMTLRRSARRSAVAALGPDTLVATDGHDWATVAPRRAAGPGGGRDPARGRSCPALPHGPRRIGYAPHRRRGARAGRRRRTGVAVLMPAPECRPGAPRRRATTGCCPEKATSFQPKPSLGVLIRSLRDG